MQGRRRGLRERHALSRRVAIGVVMRPSGHCVRITRHPGSSDEPTASNAPAAQDAQDEQDAPGDNALTQAEKGSLDRMLDDKYA